MFSLPRDVSWALLNLLPIPTDQSLSNADPSLRRPSLRSELKKKGVSSLRLRRPRSRLLVSPINRDFFHLHHLAHLSVCHAEAGLVDCLLENQFHADIQFHLT